MKNFSITDTRETLDTLKSRPKAEEFLHHVYISTVRGGIMEYFALAISDGMWGLTDAWCEMQMFITDLNDIEMIDDDEYTELLIFVNDTYLKSCDKLTKKGGKTDVENGKGQRRCNANSGRDTARNGAGTRTSKDNGKANY